MYLNRPELLQGRNTILVIMIVLSSVFLFRVMMLHQEYLHFTQFDSKVVDAEVLRHYQKTKNSKTYDVLKLRIDGSIFYTTSYKKYEPLHYKTIMIKLFIKELSFYEYLHTFYLPSHIIKIYHDRSQKENLINVIEKQHESKIIEEIYKALFLAIPVSKEVRNSISALGVAHLLAISGFHLGLLSAIIFFILKPILRYYYNSYTPYRHLNRDLFVIVSLLLFLYMWFLNFPPSLVRSYGMMIVGFILYDRGYKIISMQTLFVTVFVLLSLYPKLMLSMGFWLSVIGVFYIFLFLKIELKKRYQVVFLPLWIYIMMLPYSLYLFETFSYLHPFSTLLSSLFILFYPLSILLHMIGWGAFLDNELLWLLNSVSVQKVVLSDSIMIAFIVLSLLSIYNKKSRYILVVFGSFITVGALYQIT